jgi:hypothetical protein
VIDRQRSQLKGLGDGDTFVSSRDSNSAFLPVLVAADEATRVVSSTLTAVENARLRPTGVALARRADLRQVSPDNFGYPVLQPRSGLSQGRGSP